MDQGVPGRAGPAAARAPSSPLDVTAPAWVLQPSAGRGRCGVESPEHAVVRSPIGIGLHPIGGKQGLLPAWPVVPLGTPGRDGEVGPAVSRTEFGHVHLAGILTVLSNEGVGHTGVAVAHHQLVYRRRTGKIASRVVARNCGLRDPVFHRPGERTPINGQRVVKRSQPYTSRPDGCSRICFPVIADRTVAGQPSRKHPSSVRVRPVVEHYGYGGKLRRPSQPLDFCAQIEVGTGRRPLCEPTRRTATDLEGQAAETVSPYRRYGLVITKPTDLHRHRYVIGRAATDQHEPILPRRAPKRLTGLPTRRLDPSG